MLTVALLLDRAAFVAFCIGSISIIVIIFVGTWLKTMWLQC